MSKVIIIIKVTLIQMFNTNPFRRTASSFCRFGRSVQSSNTSNSSKTTNILNSSETTLSTNQNDTFKSTEPQSSQMSYGQFIAIAQSGSYFKTNLPHSNHSNHSNSIAILHSNKTDHLPCDTSLPIIINKLGVTSPS
jgi:hypothetical protein